MADSVDDADEFQNSNKNCEETTNKIYFKYCKNKVVTSVLCVQCGNFYHRSCIARKTMKTLDDTRIICCKTSVMDKPDEQYQDITKINQNQGNVEALKTENHYLKQLLQEVNLKYSHLMENKKLLEDKIQYLSEANKKLENDKYKNQQKNIQDKPLFNEIVKAKNDTSGGILFTNKSKQNTETGKNMATISEIDQNKQKLIKQNKYPGIISQDRQTENKDNTNFEIILEKQQQIMNDVVNLENDIKKEKNGNNEWELIKRKRRTQKKYMGQSDDDGKFKGEKSRVWIYLSRINDEVSESDIMNFLVEKTHDDKEDFIVRDLNEKKRLKTFLVAADYKFKEQFYDQKFWPKGVRFRRFDFGKHYEKYNTRQVIELPRKNETSTFLEKTKQI